MTGEEKEGDKYYLNDETAAIAQDISDRNLVYYENRMIIF